IDNVNLRIDASDIPASVISPNIPHFHSFQEVDGTINAGGLPAAKADFRPFPIYEGEYLVGNRIEGVPILSNGKPTEKETLFGRPPLRDKDYYFVLPDANLHAPLVSGSHPKGIAFTTNSILELLPPVPVNSNDRLPRFEWNVAGMQGVQAKLYVS